MRSGGTNSSNVWGRRRVDSVPDHSNAYISYWRCRRRTPSGPIGNRFFWRNAIALLRAAGTWRLGLLNTLLWFWLPRGATRLGSLNILIFVSGVGRSVMVSEVAERNHHRLERAVPEDNAWCRWAYTCNDRGCAEPSLLVSLHHSVWGRCTPVI